MLGRNKIYRRDLAFIHDAGFSDFARGAAGEIVRRLRSGPIPIRRVVDAGCGSGPLSAALTGEGFDVTGVDSSPDLLALARAAAPQAHFIHGSLYETELPPCEAIVAVGEPLTYHDDLAAADDRVAAFLRAAAAALPSGGQLIFDVIETGQPSLEGRTWASGDDWAVLSETREAQDLRVLVREIDTFLRQGDLYRRGHEVHRVRLFDG